VSCGRSANGDGVLVQQAPGAHRGMLGRARGLDQLRRVSSAIRMQAAVWPGSKVASGGTAAEQAGTAQRQRARNGNRRSGAPGRAACPGSPPGARGPARARERSPAGRTYREQRVVEQPRDRASSTMRPAYITRTRSAVSETTPMLWAMTMIAMPNSSRRSFIKVEDLRLDGDVERSGGLVFSPPLAEEAGAQYRVRAQRDHQPSAACAFSPRRTIASHAASAVSANSNSVRSAGSIMSSSTNASKFTMRRQ